MVVKSTGPDSQLVILTDQQRARAAGLAEKFDVAALIYNIATLEKLRWSVKNSDTSRALLEASLLRFALSEHFLNVDQLLSQLKPGSPAAVKKKAPHMVDSPPVRPPQVTSEEEQAVSRGPQAVINESQESAGLRDIQSVKDNWQDTLKLINSELGPGTAALLSSAVPSRFEDGVLTLEFGPSAHIRMGASKDRLERIQAFLGERFSTPLKLKFETAKHEEVQTEADQARPKTFSQKRNEILNDPAVKTVLMGLDATITGIEED
ncbi:MAG: hypothetical protein A2Z25_09535 [Planctomycetes bacterium RBG_16_55_9]|nr:MAG: hypothetical protein A2Z25_09535 [Planctomycetes bacterium RBG_16_55_9]